MKGLIKLIVLVAVTAVGLAIFTEYKPNSPDSVTEVLGLPVVPVAQVGAHGWLGMGQVATGVLVIGQGGAGVPAVIELVEQVAWQRLTSVAVS